MSLTTTKNLAQWPRKSDRITVEAEVIVRRLGDRNYRVRVYDISCHGCRVEFLSRPQLDDLAWVKFDGLESLEAVVCWVDGFIAGVKFAKPMHQAVFERIAGELA